VRSIATRRNLPDRININLDNVRIPVSSPSTVRLSLGLPKRSHWQPLMSFTSLPGCTLGVADRDDGSLDRRTSDIGDERSEGSQF
jgi:hypothetical protein